MAEPTETEAPVAGGNYEVIRARLVSQATELALQAASLNERRKETFGGQELSVIGNERVRTENNCIPRNIVNVGGRLLLAYNVYLGLKKTTAISDVFSLHRFQPGTEGFDLSALSVEEDDSEILSSDSFQKDFAELYQYYADARLQDVRITDGKLLAIFRIGPRPEDLRVFRWALNADGSATYIDNRGERDHRFPPSHDFEWKPTTRDDHVQGLHPHINILDEVFVETVGGDLTIKIEDNTADGQGIYREPVDDPHQSLDDANIRHARVGTLILLAVKPYNEDQVRYLVFDTRNKAVRRIDAIGRACVSLPEDHGIIFPGGYVLRNGVVKIFSEDTADLIFREVIRSPNGEDVIYAFSREEAGTHVLLPYNLIRQEVATPLLCHGYTRFDDGKMIITRAESAEPTRVHPMQIWQTPFTSDLHAANAPVVGGYLGKIGNPELVRGISDLMAIERALKNLTPSRQVYEDLVRACQRSMDAYHWLEHAEVGPLRQTLEGVRKNAELIIDEFEKVQALKKRAAEALAEASAQQERVLEAVRPRDWESVQEFMASMTSLREQRGKLITLAELRYVNTVPVQAMEAAVVEAFDTVSQAVVGFLLQEDSLGPVLASLGVIERGIGAAERSTALTPLAEQLAQTSGGLELLIEVVGGLEVGDPSDRTRILEGISEVFGQANRVRAQLEGKRSELAANEGRAEFAAQFKLFGQSVQSALGMSDTPERCEEQLSRLMLQLEELEGRFGELEEFLGELTARREEVWSAFEAKRQQLLEARQRRIENLYGAAQRILEAVDRRARTFKTDADLASWFAADPMVQKLRGLATQLVELGDTVKSEELQSKLKRARQDALRGLRDRLELFSEGDALLKLGRHSFSVNTTALELTMVPRGEGMSLHLTGTDFYEEIRESAFQATRPYWAQSLLSETDSVARVEYLAMSVLRAAEAHEGGLRIEELTARAHEPDTLLTAVRTITATRYDEGYERGVHDVDAARILERLLAMRRTAGLLRFAPVPRSLAALYQAFVPKDEAHAALHRQALSLGRMRASLPNPRAEAAFAASVATRMERYFERGFAEVIPHHGPQTFQVAARYLAAELAAPAPRFVASAHAVALQEALLAHLDAHAARGAFEEDLRDLEAWPAERLRVALAWVEALLQGGDEKLGELDYVSFEAAVLLATDRRLDRSPSSAVTTGRVEGLLSQHPRIQTGVMQLRLDELLDRLGRYQTEHVPAYQAYRTERSALLARERSRLRVDEYLPKVMSSFVRNQLVHEVYLPIIGDNLAKQMGASGAGKRTDNMGLLLLISPPGYGKTTLMEYVANRLGLVFMKVNGPALGHEVVSLDPKEAPNATARQEVEKINLALEMGNNVMLYLDDIQHTNPELLQKFISLCDATRRIEGVWNGRTRTYDLRGKKFAVVMAGNPYTESGARFQIPDMLANRADTSNLGDILSGREDAFALSYVENSVTSNATLQPLATRDPKDVRLIARRALGEEIDATTLSHSYTASELEEMTTVMRHLFACRDVLLMVNATYIQSAATEDAYRTEPRFQLQGSYRNMNKLAEKVVSAMNADEIQALITDHYQGEAQTLTTGAEFNLLKLAELRGRLDLVQSARLAEIRKEFARRKMMGGADDDPIARVTGTLATLNQGIEGVGAILQDHSALGALQAELAAIRAAFEAGPRLDAPLAALSRELGGVRAAIAQGPRLDAPLGEIGAHIEQLTGTLQRAAPLSASIEGMGAKVAELLAQAITAAMEQSDRTSQRTAKAVAEAALRANQATADAALKAVRATTEATNAAMAQARPPADERGSWPLPNLELSTEADVVLRHAILLEVQRALVTQHRMQGGAHKQLRTGQLILSGALPVMQQLAVQVTNLVSEHVHPTHQEAFLDALRRGVAEAIRGLSETTGENVDGYEVLPGPGKG